MLHCYTSFKECNIFCKGLLHTWRNGVLCAKSFASVVCKSIFPSLFIINREQYLLQKLNVKNATKKRALTTPPSQKFMVPPNTAYVGEEKVQIKT
jgi:hypothetical protein